MSDIELITVGDFVLELGYSSTCVALFHAYRSVRMELTKAEMGLHCSSCIAVFFFFYLFRMMLFV